jgi:hypothetical protein
VIDIATTKPYVEAMEVDGKWVMKTWDEQAGTFRRERAGWQYRSTDNDDR